MDSPLADRVTELEARITFQEDVIDELQRSLYAQGLQLEQLQTRLEHAIAAVRLGSLQAEEERTPDEQPPHY